MRVLILFCSGILIFSKNLSATYAHREYVDVPVQRLVKHFEKELEVALKTSINPKNDRKVIRAKTSLARLHTMAYAKKIEKIKASKYKDSWLFESGGRNISEQGATMPSVLSSQTQYQKDKAQRHLRLAIKLYRDIYSGIQVKHWRGRKEKLRAKLGLAWSLHQAGETNEALQLYRELIRQQKLQISKGPFNGINQYQLFWSIPSQTTDLQITKGGSKYRTINIYAYAFKSVYQDIVKECTSKKYADKERLKELHAIGDEVVKALNAANYDIGISKWTRFEETLREIQDATKMAKAHTKLKKLRHLSINGALVVNRALDWLRKNLIFLKFAVSNKNSSQTLNKEFRRIWATLDVNELAEVQIKSLLLQNMGEESETRFKAYHNLRKGPSVQYEFHLLNIEGHVLAKTKKKVRKIKPFDSHPQPPQDFILSEHITDFEVAEVASYLIQLLNPAKDREEIMSAKKLVWVKSQNKSPRMVTPIAIPMYSQATRPSKMIAPDILVNFDLDGTMQSQIWNWIKPNVGWLVFDRLSKPGVIDSGIYLFGNVTFWMFWQNGYQPLCALDDDKDGGLQGHELERLAIWRDINSNGKSEEGEVKSLSAYKIIRLSCAYRPHEDGGYYSENGVIFEDGHKVDSFDLILQSH